jgi:hypothetical protein
VSTSAPTGNPDPHTWLREESEESGESGESGEFGESEQPVDTYLEACVPFMEESVEAPVEQSADTSLEACEPHMGESAITCLDRRCCTWSPRKQNHSHRTLQTQTTVAMA